MKSPKFLILDKHYLGKVLAVDPLRQSGQRSSSEQQKAQFSPHYVLQAKPEELPENGVSCWVEIALSIVAATSAAELLFVHHQEPADFPTPRYTS